MMETAWRTKRVRPLATDMASHRREAYRWRGWRYAKSGYRGRLTGDVHGPEHFYWTERFGGCRG